jgi:transcriptional regulator with XRE-family HTH domain
MNFMFSLSPMRLAEIRKRRGLTQVQLAEMSGVEQATISRIERGSDAVTVRGLRQIADALHVSVADLFLEDRDAAENALIKAFRALPPDRQAGWLDLARTLVQPRSDDRE